MGGPGSGRHYRWNTKDTVDDYRKVDVRELADHDILRPGWSGNWQWHRDEKIVASIGIRCESRDRLRFVYTTSEPAGDEEHDYPVPLDWTACNFGGERPWFRCPGKGCGRRCAILYGGAVFVCRECRDLAYRSQNVSGDRHAEARLELWRLADKMGFRDHVADAFGPIEYVPLPDKPKGMHWETWNKLVGQWHRAAEEAVEAMREKIQELAGRSEGGDE